MTYIDIYYSFMPRYHTHWQSCSPRINRLAKIDPSRPPLRLGTGNENPISQSLVGGNARFGGRPSSLEGTACRAPPGLPCLSFAIKSY
jgi:hypothetical protein